MLLHALLQELYQSAGPGLRRFTRHGLTTGSASKQSAQAEVHKILQLYKSMHPIFSCIKTPPWPSQWVYWSENRAEVVAGSA